MESVVKVGRSVGGGFFRAAGAVLRGTRRVLAAIPLLGIIIKEDIDKDTVWAACARIIQIIWICMG